jgi:hypothetical protein
LVEKRLGVLQDEIGDVARRAAGEQVADEMRALRQRTTVVGAFAVGLAAAALMTALDVI